MCSASPGGHSLERLVHAHGERCGNRQYWGGSEGKKRGQAAFRCCSHDADCKFRVNAKHIESEDLYYITGLQAHTCLVEDAKVRRKHAFRAHDGKNQLVLNSAIGPKVAGGGGGGQARSLQKKLVQSTGNLFGLSTLRREMSCDDGGTALQKAMECFGFLRSDLMELAKSHPSLAIALETGPLAQQFCDISEEGGWQDPESEDDRRHTFRIVFHNMLIFVPSHPRQCLLHLPIVSFQFVFVYLSFAFFYCTLPYPYTPSSLASDFIVLRITFLHTGF